MSYCYICGEEKDLVFRHDVLRFACKTCSSATAHKMGRSEFYWKYFGNEPVMESIKREFYDDYRSSNLNFADYVVQTTKHI